MLLPAQLAAAAVLQAPHSSAAFKPSASAAISGAVFAAGSGSSRQQQQQKQTVLAGRPLDVPPARGRPAASLATAAAAAAAGAGGSGDSTTATGSLSPPAVPSGRTSTSSEQQQLRHDFATLGVVPPRQVGLVSSRTGKWCVSQLQFAGLAKQYFSALSYGTRYVEASPGALQNPVTLWQPSALPPNAAAGFSPYIADAGSLVPPQPPAPLPCAPHLVPEGGFEGTAAPGAGHPQATLSPQQPPLPPQQQIPFKQEQQQLQGRSGAMPLHMQLMASLQAATRQSQRQSAALAGGEEHIPAALPAPVGGLYATTAAAAGSSPAAFQAGTAAAGGPPQVCKRPSQQAPVRYSQAAAWCDYCKPERQATFTATASLLCSHCRCWPSS